MKNFRAIALLLSTLGAGLMGPPALSAEDALSHHPSAVGSAPIWTVERVSPVPLAVAATPLAPTAPGPPPLEALSPTDEAAAPSVLWLIAMPAVPIVGGALICLSRRGWGRNSQESRLVAHVPPPKPLLSKDAPPHDEA